MKRKFVTSILTLVSVTAALAGCGHQHTFSNDWTSNSSKHWHQATCGHNLAINIEEHVDSNNNGLCDVCNWNMSGQHVHNFSTTWSTNITEHWHECSCGEKANVGVHVDSNNDNFCDVCGFALVVPPHVHTFDTEWANDDTQHWHQATCGHDVKGNLSPHVDSNSDGYCDICNYKMGEPDPDGYYSSIISDLTGNDLLSALQRLNSSKRKNQVSYAGMKSFAPICDANPDNPSRMVGFYNNKDLPNSWDNQATWNREHVWPNSLGGNKVEDDAFMPRPCDVGINGDRGNQVYSKTAYDPGSEGYPNYRGICARIIFYCAIANNSLKIVDNDKGSSSAMGKLSDLLEWNLTYLPSKSNTAALELKVEQNRNEVIHKHKNGQGNRNPFVDHPEYACKIWGNTNAATRKACGL